MNRLDPDVTRAQLTAFLASQDIDINKLPDNCIWLRWWSWRLDHPDVETQLYDLARRVRERGFVMYGIGALWEVLRWHRTIERTEEFKCANAYRSRYARFLMWLHPELEGFFDTAELKTT